MLKLGDSFQNTALHYSSHNRDVEIVLDLLEYYPDPSSKRFHEDSDFLINAMNKLGHTPLHVCCKKPEPGQSVRGSSDQLACANALIKKGANPKILDKSMRLAIELVDDKEQREKLNEIFLCKSH